jgi:hypothetical protein
MSKALFVVVAAGLAAGAPVQARDFWESGGTPAGDGSALTRNVLAPGIVQQHDLEHAPQEDFDWAVVPTLRYHSYEARINGSNVKLDDGSCAACAQFERVDASGAVLTEAMRPLDAVHALDRAVRWIATADTVGEFVRVRGATDEDESEYHVYTLRYHDTTYTVPRWNASGGQTTVLILSSLAQEQVSGSVHFFSGTGALVHTQPFTLTRNAPLVFNAGSVAALSGQSGFALVAHTAGYGGLSGKAVALEPSTGFTFDTALQPIPQ